MSNRVTRNAFPGAGRLQRPRMRRFDLGPAANDGPPASPAGAGRRRDPR